LLSQEDGALFYYEYRTSVSGDSASAANIILGNPQHPSRLNGIMLENALKALFDEQAKIEKLGFDPFDAAAALARLGGDGDRALAELVAQGPQPLERKDPRRSTTAAAASSSSSPSSSFSSRGGGSGEGGAAASSAGFTAMGRPTSSPMGGFSVPQAAPRASPAATAAASTSSQLVRDLVAMGFTQTEAEVFFFLRE